MIQKFKFGKFVIDDKEYEGDIKIIENEVIKWKTRQGHDVFLEDVMDLIKEKPTTLIVGIGDPGYLKVSQEVKETLQRKKIKLIEQPTRKACKTYNELYQKEKVCAIFHATC